MKKNRKNLILFHMILSQIEPKNVVGTKFFNVNFLFLYPNIVPNIKLVVGVGCTEVI